MTCCKSGCLLVFQAVPACIITEITFISQVIYLGINFGEDALKNRPCMDCVTLSSIMHSEVVSKDRWVNTPHSVQQILKNKKNYQFEFSMSGLSWLRENEIEESNSFGGNQLAHYSRVLLQFITVFVCFCSEHRYFRNLLTITYSWVEIYVTSGRKR